MGPLRLGVLGAAPYGIYRYLSPSPDGAHE